MTCLDMFFIDINKIADCKMDCIGCKRTDCEDDRRRPGREPIPIKELFGGLYEQS